MSRRLLQLVMPVFPDRRMFRIHDPDVHPDSPGGPLPPIGVLVSSNREQLWVGSLQQDIDVRLVLEEWDGQPLLPDSWEEEGKARLYLRGQLSVDMGSAGTAVSRLRLSGGVGNYEVRVYARYREAVVQMYADLFSQHKDPLSDEFQREKRKLEGVERYLVQLWRDSLSGYPRRALGGVPRRALGGAGARSGYPAAVAAVFVPLVLATVPAPWRPAAPAVFAVEAFRIVTVFCAVEVVRFALPARVLAGLPAFSWEGPGRGAIRADVLTPGLDAWGLDPDLGRCSRKGTIA